MLLGHGVTSDKVTSVFNLVECSLDIGVPGLQLVIGSLLLVQEYYDALESVNFGLNSFINHHVADFLLGSRERDSDKLCKSLKSNP